ncbi:hypothetical protein [Enterococcus sp. CWB-B31]|uniref:hypothetical protein n=1 Tax=Enterococcus sp. CWB-B31 TaxID=2885159 RepID=UPI001E42EB39|nr:hypothetical protein [Enterococcus sp. CWB-B31]MCB5955754.1 hypothetical protein [Enterococcus sp. CWB-B31]
MIGIMEQNEQLKDWTFRYQYVYRLRRTNKQKQRFLSALAADIVKMRQDIQVIEYKQNKKYISSNLYVGNIETADRIICTYYDTPPQGFGPYYLFDRKKQSKAVTSFILATSIASLLIGLLLTVLYMRVSNNTFDFASFNTLLIILGYGVYFYLLSKVAKGLSSRKNLIRNTSSVLSLLTLIQTIKGNKMAFAFVDEGSFGDMGLDVLKSSCKASAKIYALDCVGADTELHFMGNFTKEDRLKGVTVHQPSDNQVSYLFGARNSIGDHENAYYLKKSDLKKKVLNQKNLTKIIELFN